MYVLGIESTAHTFGVGIIDSDGNILADARARYAPPKGMGIEPFSAAEHHSKKAINVLREALSEAGLGIRDIDVIAFSRGPGLGPCLRVGASLARYLALRYGKPLYPVHHGIGHLELVMHHYSLRNPLHLLVSGGHTSILVQNGCRYRVFGETLDITIGNLLDVLAREAGLDFPGGPAIESLAKKGGELLELPYTIIGTSFQFSGILTKAIQLLKTHRIEDVAYSVQEVAFSIIVEAVERALRGVSFDVDGIALSGGVASNDTLYNKLRVMAERYGVEVYRLPKKLNGDNGVQIAVVGLRMATAGIKPPDIASTGVVQKWRIDEVDIPWAC